MSDDTPVSTILQQLTTLELRLAAWDERYPGGRPRYEQFVDIFDGERRAGLWSATTVPIIAELKEILGKREALIRELLRRGHDRTVIDRAIHKNVAQVREERTNQLLGIDETSRRKKKRRLRSRGKEEEASQEPLKRASGTVGNLNAARKMNLYLDSKAIGLTDFASSIGTTDRTLRSFRKTGKVRRDIFKAIATGMGINPEELLKT